MRRVTYGLAVLALLLAGCEGDVGAMGQAGAPGPQGPAGQDLTVPPATFTVSRVAAAAMDPTGPSNEVFVINNAGTQQEGGDPLSAGSIHAIPLPATLDALTDTLSVWYYFAAGKGCGVGSPRAHIRLDTNADGAADVELWGALGPDPNAGVACTAQAWVKQEFTDAVARWSRSGAGAMVTWAALLADVTATFPAYTIVDAFLVEDAEFYGLPADDDPSNNTTPTGVSVGATYYDDFRVGDVILSHHVQAQAAP